MTATYIESGTFQGGEEDVYNAGIERDEECVILKQNQHAALQEVAELAKKILDKESLTFSLQCDLGIALSKLATLKSTAKE